MCDLITDGRTGQGPSETRIWLTGPGLHHSGCRAVTHPLSEIWDSVGVRVNWGSAMEELVLLSVSE